MIGAQRVRLGDVLRRSTDEVDIDPTRVYQEVTAKLWGRGIVPRRAVSGAEIAASRRFVARAGQFILSRIDARNGAMGLVPEELDGAVVTNDFPLFLIDADRALPAYLEWMSRTAGFVELCRRASEGTTNRVRLQEEKFLSMEIALPPLEEQRRLVECLDDLTARIKAACDARDQALAQADALLGTARLRAIGEPEMGRWVRLDRFIARIDNGRSPQCESRRAVDGEWGVLKVGAVSFGTFDPLENKALPGSIGPRPEYEVRVGDFLMSRANTVDLVGACAIVRSTPPRLLLSDKTFRFVFREEATMLPVFLEHLLKSPPLREQIEIAATGTSPTMKNISKEKVLALRVPDLPVARQHDIVRWMAKVEAKAHSARELQVETVTELRAMTRAIIARFLGRSG